MPIHFFTEDIPLPSFDQDKISGWLKTVAQEHSCEIADMSYIFCTDEYLLTINQQYLDHDYFTDIITFNQSEEEGKLEADIFISIDRVMDNAKKLQTHFEQELHRVMVHGLLHLLGFKDSSDTEKKTMREKEDACLSLLSEL